MVALAKTSACIAGAAAITWLGYNCYSPTSQLYGSTIARPDDARAIALTFDDGPNERCTLALLDVLEHHGARATFFLIGRFVAVRPSIARHIAEAGHSIGNHTYTHPNLLFASGTEVRGEIVATSNAISDATGVQTRWFRPPFGARRPAVLKIARELGLTPVMWNVTAFDWNPTTAERVFQTASRGIAGNKEKGHLVLLHDGGHRALGADRQHTVEATERLISACKQHYYFQSLDQICPSAVPTASI